MRIYILAPAHNTSGGPELAHQLCNAINRLSDIPAFMCYVDTDAPFDKALACDVEAPVPYEIYHTDHVKSMEELDSPDSIIIFPEGLTLSMPYVLNARKMLWWMSVDNYIVSTGENNLDYIRQNVCLHLYQSYYAKDYVEKKIPQAQGMYLSDYINEEHGKFIYPAKFRQNMALYNPAKGYNELKPLIDKSSWLNWVPLVNLDIPHMILFMQTAKIYVDFGNHPGKDRIPREAAANGGVVITNTKGAAAFTEDVPIPDKYKFASPADQLDEIDILMHDICDNFEHHQSVFSDYRKFIAGERERFDSDTLRFLEVLRSF